MKKIDNKIKILSAISILIILAGIIVTLTLGFKFDLKYQETKRIELYLNKEFEISDIKKITDEVLENQIVLIQKVEVFDDTVSIIAKDITDEQKTDLIAKINEKYETELSEDSIEITKVPHIKGRDIIKPYIAPILISTLIILIYMAIRFYKLGSTKVLLVTALTVCFVQAILFSVIAIARIPIGRLTMPIVIAIYLLTLTIVTNSFENKLNKINEAEKGKKK